MPAPNPRPTLNLIFILNLKWWKEKWVSSVLESENAEEEAVHQEDDSGPGHDGDALCFGIGYAWNLDCEGDCCEGEDAI